MSLFEVELVCTCLKVLNAVVGPGFSHRVKLCNPWKMLKLPWFVKSFLTVQLPTIKEITMGLSRFLS